MAVGIVYRLEAIKVHEQHSKTRAVSLSCFYGLFNAVGKQCSIGQPGKRIVKGHVFQGLIGLVQRPVQFACARGMATVEHGDDQRYGQHGQGYHCHDDRQPMRVDSHYGGATYAAQRELRGLHAAVVHADDGAPHDDGRGKFQRCALGRPSAQVGGDPKSGARSRNRYEQRKREPEWVIHDARHHHHGFHAQIMHACHAHAHDQCTNA